jgi:hypothetical protein
MYLANAQVFISLRTYKVLQQKYNQSCNTVTLFSSSAAAGIRWQITQAVSTIPQL